MVSGQIARWLRQFTLASLAFVACIAVIYRFSSTEEIVYLQVANKTFSSEAPTVVLDAGHGGEDCGAVGVNGVYEKDLNFSICAFLAAQLRSAGYRVIETRTKDALLYDHDTVTPGHKKVTDLTSRLEIASSYPGALVISIHMNSFPSPSSCGLQVWYSPAFAEAKELAEGIQTQVKNTLQPENHRKPKGSAGAIYLLDRAENPTVLVECGFLTNPEECAKLTEGEYQKELSFVLFCAIMDYIMSDV